MEANNKIENPKTEVSKSLNMNDCDFLTTVLELEKNMSSNLNTALNEASNEDLYDELFDIYTDIKECARDLYELSFKKGWYSLEKAEDNKLSTKYEELSSKLSEIQQ